MWDPLGGVVTARLFGHTSPLVAVRLGARSPQLVSASVDGVVKVWDLLTSSCEQTIHCAGAIRAREDRELGRLPASRVVGTTGAGAGGGGGDAHSVADVELLDESDGRALLLVASGCRVFAYATEPPDDPRALDARFVPSHAVRRAPPRETPRRPARVPSLG